MSQPTISPRCIHSEHTTALPVKIPSQQEKMKNQIFTLFTLQQVTFCLLLESTVPIILSTDGCAFPNSYFAQVSLSFLPKMHGPKDFQQDKSH